jgi:transcriptional regulator with XRE-family HTH domain
MLLSRPAQGHSPRLTARGSLPFCHFRLKTQKPLSPYYPNNLNTLGDHLRKKRLDLGLRQNDVADKIAVHEATIYSWEKNRTSPPVQYIPRIIQFIGYVPYNTEFESVGQELMTRRHILGLTQEAMARRLGVDPTTLRRWERGRSRASNKSMGKIRVFPVNFS